MESQCSDVVFRDVEFGRGISAQHKGSKDCISLQKRERDYLENSWWQRTGGSCLQKQLLSRQIHNTIVNSVRHVLNNKVASFWVKNQGGRERNVLGKLWSREQRDVGKLFAPRSPCCSNFSWKMLVMLAGQRRLLLNIFVHWHIFVSRWSTYGWTPGENAGGLPVAR